MRTYGESVFTIKYNFFKTLCFIVRTISVAFTFINTDLNLPNILFRTVIEGTSERTGLDLIV
jgi:hypothetical protein